VAPGVDRATFRGRETLVLFWNPGCGLCERILPGLKRQKEADPGGAGDSGRFDR